MLAATREADGTYAIALVHSGLPGYLLGARRGSPLVVGLGNGENFLASDVSPIVAHTRKVIYLHDGDIVPVSPATSPSPPTASRSSAPSARSIGRPKRPSAASIRTTCSRKSTSSPTAWPKSSAGRCGPAHGMVEFEETALSPKELAKIRRLLLVACGTSWHAALAGEYIIETLARLPVEVECASEMRYRNRPIEKNTLVVPISQSGETADTLAAIRGARAQGARTLAIVNVAGSTIARESDADISKCAPAPKSASPPPRPSKCRSCG